MYTRVPVCKNGFCHAVCSPYATVYVYVRVCVNVIFAMQCVHYVCVHVHLCKFDFCHAVCSLCACRCVSVRFSSAM